MNNEVKVGLTVLLAIIVAIVGFRFMRDVPLFRQSLEISAQFERADGISGGSLVYIKGVRVGSVRSVELTPQSRINLSMRIDTEVPIPKNSVANLTSLGIVEGKSIVIELGDSPEIVEFGDIIEGHYVESMMETLGQQGEEIGSDVSSAVSELDSFLKQLNSTLNDETRENIDQTIEGTMRSVNALSEVLESKQGDIESAITAGSSMIQQLDTLAADTRPRADSLLTAVEKNLQELERVQVQLESATESLNVILEKINNGEGTIGRLVNDPSMYDNLDTLTAELSELVRGINENPGRYLRHMSLIEIF